ncbi:phospholipase [Bradyrhizobium cosmicum]|uniref:phospholipase n=1 Tax=Bradyrhizobium cosmicum TaxID=1404864 RepID=UPI0011652833|nr:phospholipase [Bradyrhizobium cosmicum]QDP20645.1 phospholipase [Bradyrhizobium cosmicum]QDP20696.1 phospholipase [Bradyrhizobium cosmicum]
MPRPTDLTATAFDQQLKLHGFFHIRAEGRFADVRAKGCPRTEPVMRGKRIDRQATLAALLAARNARAEAAAATEAVQIERERVASLIAPVAMPPARASLDGAEAIAQLADDFIVLTTRSDGAALPDLLRMGWRKSQVFEHTDAARNLAYSRQNGAAV